MIDEGYIKYEINLTDGPTPEHPELIHLNMTRTKLHDLTLIGVYDNGIGYGNLSIRTEDHKKFIISGTATGSEHDLPLEKYCLVDDFNTDTNEVYCTGKVQASSESMSHGSVYRANSAVNCVIHVHSRTLFDFMLANDYQRTAESAAFGTPEIALEFETQINNNVQDFGLFATAGHDEGIIAYGPDIDSTYNILFDIYNTYKEEHNG